MTQLKWLMYCSEEPKLATNVSQIPQLWTEFQTRELLEWASQMHLHLGWSHWPVPWCLPPGTTARDHSVALTPCLQPEVLHLLFSDCVTF